MLWLIIGGSIFLAALFIGIVRDNASPQKYSDHAFNMGMASFMFAVVFILGMNALAGIWTHPKYTTDRWQLRSLGNGDSRIHGGFFLGSGYINSTEVYDFYIDNGDGSFNEYNCDRDESTIHNYDGQPYVTETTEHPGNLWQSFFVGTASQYLACDFYVPNGSVKQVYTLNPN